MREKNGKSIKKTEERLSRNLQRKEIEEQLLLAVMYFAAVVLDMRERLKIMASYVLKAAKRVFGIPDFKYYALADGLRSLFARHPGHPRRQSRAPDPQILLFSLESS